MEYQILQFETHGYTGLIRINRPEALNALNTRFFEEMNQLLDELEVRQDLRCLVITGTGKAFVAGADIAEMANKDQEAGSAFSRFGQDTFQRLEDFRLPVIAAINGFALGGGLELAMACDIRLASALAKFGQPEVNLGLIPGYAATQRLPRLTGMGDALYLLVSGDMIDANEALRIGLVQKVFPAETLHQEAMDLAARIGSKGPVAVGKVKQVSRQGIRSNFQDGCRLESLEFGLRFTTPEATEGMAAFLEKRKPNWNK